MSSNLHLLTPPRDPVPIFELFNGNFASKILVVAAVHFDIFNKLQNRELTFNELRDLLSLEERPMVVLTTVLLAHNLIIRSPAGRYSLSELSSMFLTDNGTDVSDYLHLSADADGVLDLLHRLKTNTPAGHDPDGLGTQYTFRQGVKSAMSNKVLARNSTLALAGRAKATAPVLADTCPLTNACTLLDIGAGTGIFSIAYLQRHPKLRAVLVDRPNVLEVARELAAEYGLTERIEFCAADMFRDALPTNNDAILLSNVLHDWDIPDCRLLLRRCHGALANHGQLIIHDAFLQDDLAGPRAIAVYSVILFYLTEGRAYSAAECREWLDECGFEPSESLRPTMVHCSALRAMRLA